MQLSLYGDPNLCVTFSSRSRVIERVQRFFAANPDHQFLMLTVSSVELRTLARAGLLSGCLGQPRSHRTNTHRRCNIDFDRTGRMWVVVNRDWRRIDPFSGAFRPGSTAAPPWSLPGCILIPHLPGDLPPLVADEADTLGEFLWRDWEKSTGLSDAQAGREAELSAYAIRALWLHDHAVNADGG